MTELSRKSLFTLTLRDKPIGYAAGQDFTVQKCPRCGEHGVPSGERWFLHTLEIVEVVRTRKDKPARKTTEVAKSDRCEVV